MSNFDFLKNVNKNIYEIITDAEKLYRDEYFEQCISQTRRFGEVVCKDVLGNSRTTERTFDDMLATLKDKVSNAIQEKEFVDDLYFLKREGNASVHASSVKKDGIIALECLQRAFEIAINYTVYYKKSNKNLLKRQFDTELLITGERSKKSLKEKYLEEKSKQKTSKKEKNNTKIYNKPQKNKKNKPKNKKFSIFWILLFISVLISIVLTLTILLLSFV